MRKLFISFSAFLFCQQCLALDVGPIVQLSYKGNSESSPDNIMQYVLHNPNSIEVFVLDKRNSHLGTNSKGTETAIFSEPTLSTTQRDTIPFLRFEELIDSLTKQNIVKYIRNMRESFESMKYPILENESSFGEGKEFETKGLNKIIQNTFLGFPMNFSSYECTDEQSKTENLNIIKKVCLSIKPENVNRIIYVKYPTTEETSRKVFKILSNFPHDLSIQDIKDVGSDQYAMEESKNNNTNTVIIGKLLDNINEKVQQGIEHTIKNHILKEAIDTYLIKPEATKKEIHHGAIRKHKKRATKNNDRMNAPSRIPLNMNMKGQEDKKIKIQVINNLPDKHSRNTSFLSKGAALEEDDGEEEEEDTDEDEEDDDTDGEEEEEDTDEDEEDDDGDTDIDDDDEDGDTDTDIDDEDDDEDAENNDDNDADNFNDEESLNDMAQDLLDASNGRGSLSVKQVKVLKDLTDKVKKHNTIDDIKKHAYESNEETENKIKEYQAYQKKTIKKIHESKESIYDMINADLNALLKPAQKEYLKVAESLKQKLLKQYDDMLNEVKDDE